MAPDDKGVDVDFDAQIRAHQKTLDAHEQRIVAHGEKICMLESATETHTGQLKLGAVSMARRDEEMKALQTKVGDDTHAMRAELREWGTRTLGDTNASNQRVEAKIDDQARKLEAVAPKPWPLWLRGVVTSLGLGGVVVAVQIIRFFSLQPSPETMGKANDSIHAVEIKQAEQAKDLTSIKESTVRQEQAQRDLMEQVIRLIPGKAVQP